MPRNGCRAHRQTCCAAAVSMVDRVHGRSGVSANSPVMLLSESVGQERPHRLEEIAGEQR